MQKITSLKLSVIASCLLLSPNVFAAESAQTVALQSIASNLELLLTKLPDQPVAKKGFFQKLAAKELHKQLATPKGIAFIAFMISLYIYNAREADNSPDRYDVEKFLARLQENPLDLENFCSFVYYFILDGIIGNRRKPATLKAASDGSIEVKIGAPSRGLYGKIEDAMKPVLTTLGFPKDCENVAETTVSGLAAWVLLEAAVDSL